MGAWIETCNIKKQCALRLSRPTWARGLKPLRDDHGPAWQGVAPHVGAWIETFLRLSPVGGSGVAPHVGAWIETIT